LCNKARWSRNRQCFLGKDGKDFLYWRYEGWTPEYARTQLAEWDALPPEHDSFQTFGMNTRMA
jgi:hypothetical protein